jgi:hypothetical protein
MDQAFNLLGLKSSHCEIIVLCGDSRLEDQSVWCRDARMNTHLYLLAFVLLGTYPALAEQPFILAQTIEMPEVPTGPYADHMALDLKGRRLFTTPQANKAIDVLDLTTGKVLRTIRGFGNPHAILFRGDKNRLFVTDGDGDGALDILDATSYSQIKSIRLERDADGIGYDAKTNC